MLERIKIEKGENLVATLHNKPEYAIHLRNLIQALNLGLVFKKLDRIIKFKQKAWLKPYIDMYTEKKAKLDSEKDFFKLMNNAVLKKNYGKFEKT